MQAGKAGRVWLTCQAVQLWWQTGLKCDFFNHHYREKVESVPFDFTEVLPFFNFISRHGARIQLCNHDSTKCKLSDTFLASWRLSGCFGNVFVDDGGVRCGVFAFQERKVGDLICKFHSESPAVDRFCSIGKIGDKTFECYPLLDMLTHCCTLRHDSIIPAVFHDFAVFLASLLGFERLDRRLQSCTSWISWRTVASLRHPSRCTSYRFTNCVFVSFQTLWH